MIQIIAGKKGKGKTKYLLAKVNSEIKSACGNFVYLDKNTKHMYELNNRVRLINMSEFSIMNSEQFIGFVYGIISQDNDLEQMYLDSFLTIAKAENTDITSTLNSLEEISNKYNFVLVLSISLDENELPESFKSKVVISL